VVAKDLILIDVVSKYSADFSIFTQRGPSANEFSPFFRKFYRNAAEGKVSTKTGRCCMEQWEILVLGVLRLGLDADYDGN
jgi:hypothetical protein